MKNYLIKKKLQDTSFAKLGISSGGLTDLLNKKVKNPRIDTLLKIAKALDLDDHEFAELCGYRKDDKDGI